MTDDTWDNDMVKEMAAVSNSGACSCIAPDLCSCSENASNIDNHLPVNTVYYEDIAACTFTTEYEVSFQEEVELSSGEAKTIADFTPSGEEEEETETQNKHQTTRARDKEEKRLHHNEAQRIREKKRKHSKDELKETILLDDLIPWSADQQWPVVKTLQRAQELILAHHRELKKRGMTSRIPLPFSSKTSPVFEPPAAVLYEQFKEAMQPSFRDILRRYHVNRHEDVDEATLSEFVADVWSWMPPIERLHTWLWISEEKKDEIAEFAVRVLHEAADLL